MQTALYYPFTGPQRESFLKSALFLWDSVDFIVPSRGFHHYLESQDEQEALEIVGSNYVPTIRDKQDAHDELSKLCSAPIPTRYKFALESPSSRYDFYPEKLLRETWEMLSESDLARVVSDNGSVRRASTSPLFGYYMMTILAVCCSRGQKRMITDQVDPYHVLTTLLADESPTEVFQDDWHGRLIALTLDGPDFSKIPLRRLIELRTKEDKLLASQRQAFVAEVDKAAADIMANAENPNIVRERIREFTTSMERDLCELKRALRLSGASLLLSKEFGVSVMAAVAAVPIAPIPGVILTLGGLAKGLLEGGVQNSVNLLEARRAG